MKLKRAAEKLLSLYVLISESILQGFVSIVKVAFILSSSILHNQNRLNLHHEKMDFPDLFNRSFFLRKKY